MSSGPASGDRSGLVIDACSTVLEQAFPDPSRSFLDLGGDSLQAMQLCARLSAALGRDIPPRLLLEAPSLDEFCARVEQVPAAPRAAPGAAQPGEEPQLSFSQERMCFMHELSLGSAAYHVPMAWRLRGRVDTDAMRAAFDTVVARHAILRTAIATGDGRLTPRFGAAAPPELVEASLLTGRAQRHEALDRYLAEFANAPFQLDRGPLLRAALLNLDAGESVLVAVFHHVVADQWALDVFFRELAACYAAALARQPPQLPPPGNFGLYAALHRRWFARERQAPELAYWTDRLRGLEPTVLHEDFVRPVQQAFAGARLRLDFRARDIRALRQFGAAHGATLAMVLLAALKVLLMRHTGRPDIAVGLPVANRGDPASWGLMGTLVNTLVSRTELDPRGDFLAVLERVRSGVLDALEHQDLPFEQLVRAVHLERDASRPALFSVMFNMLNTPLGEVRLPGLKWSRHEFDKRAAQFDLTVTVDARHAHSISFEYATSVFSAETIQRLAERYMRLLHEVVADAARPLDAMELIPDAELRVLREWSQGPRRPRTSATVDGLLWPQFSALGAEPAIRSGAETLTYGQLGQAAEAMARALAGRGVGRGSLVGLHLQRTPRMLAALLGVLRSGAAYVPLDPAYPADRLAFMAGDAQLALLVTDSGDAAQAVPWPSSCPCVGLDELLATAASGAIPLPVAGTIPSDVAYVIYTSGSTGQPKGVAVPHGAVVNFLRSMHEQPGLARSDRLLAITTLSFDIAVLELLLPLLAGASIVLASREQQTDGEALAALLDRHRITLMQATPSTWRLLLDAGWRGSMELRALVGGEPLARELANELQLRCAEVWNMYGPTETTVWSSCGRAEAPGRERISLGRPIANTTIHVLDDGGRLCPIGVPGEICIGGDGVAIGYLGRPELTAARFIANEHSSDRRGGRLYRTGDRGRWRTDGRLEHLGRLDAQVKVRGYRIEPGEIESRLAAHPGLQANVVLVDMPPGGAAMLVAWVVPRHDAPQSRELRAYLRQWLPEYMIPQHFVPIPALPLLPNGKLDRQALPPPRGGDLPGEPAIVPRDPTEEAVWQVWSQALRNTSFGIHDNLFDIGGHSLLAVQIVNRIREGLRVPCSLSLLLRHPTVAGLAGALAGGAEQPGWTVVPLQAGGTGPELFCLCGISLYRELADALAPGLRVCAVFVTEELAMFGGTGGGEAAPDIPRLARAYLDAIRRRQPQGPYRLLGFSFGGVVAFEVAQQLRSQGEEVELLAILDSDVPGTATATLGGRLRRLGRLVTSLGRRLLPTGEAPEGPMLDERSYITAMRRYQPRGYSGSTLYVKSSERNSYDPGYGWNRLLGAPRWVALRESHLGILKGASAGRIATELRELLR